VKYDLGSNCIPCECRLDTEHHRNHKQRKWISHMPPFFLDCLNLKKKTLWTFETLGITSPVTLCYILEQLNCAAALLWGNSNVTHLRNVWLEFQFHAYFIPCLLTAKVSGLITTKLLYSQQAYNEQPGTKSRQELIMCEILKEGFISQTCPRYI